MLRDCARWFGPPKLHVCRLLPPVGALQQGERAAPGEHEWGGSPGTGQGGLPRRP